MLSKNKERQLVKLYPSTDDADIARILGVGLWVIKKRAGELGLEKYQFDQDAYVQRMTIKILQENYASTSNDELADAIGIPKSQIEHEAFRLGLRKSEEYWSNIIITTEEDDEENEDMMKFWNELYDHKKDGSSRGNFVIGTMLRYLFPNYTRQPERPIGGLRIDWYIHELKLGFEIQGIQHTEYNNFHFETKNDFKRAQERDYHKSDLCQKSGITLVYIYHDEKLSIPLVRAKIKEVI